ncbi:hypothetical protein [Luteitalea sp.]|uniref:hypothetical protein n=1 Tax=Luteitalea sp. TaxID=2004800 RepID=UPI0025C09636|nr:hypothetical protein [Luteitalea sp.]
MIRFGIREQFMALRSHHMSADRVEHERALALDYHLGETFSRLLFVLQELNHVMQELGATYDRGGDDWSSPHLYMLGECLADQSMAYLGMVVDDIAILVAIAVGAPGVDGMGALKRTKTIAVLRAENAAIADSVTSLDESGSWWDVGFRRGAGVRQLITHLHHSVRLQVSRAPDEPHETSAFVSASGPRPGAGNFTANLRSVLVGLCHWLERLEPQIATVLRRRGISASIATTDRDWCPHFRLPVGMPPSTRMFHARYFPFPYCEGSAHLPVTCHPPEPNGTGGATASIIIGK